METRAMIDARLPRSIPNFARRAISRVFLYVIPAGVPVPQQEIVARLPEQEIDGGGYVGRNDDVVRAERLRPRKPIRVCRKVAVEGHQRDRETANLSAFAADTERVVGTAAERLPPWEPRGKRNHVLRTALRTVGRRDRFLSKGFAKLRQNAIFGLSTTNHFVRRAFSALVDGPAAHRGPGTRPRQAAGGLT